MAPALTRPNFLSHCPSLQAARRRRQATRRAAAAAACTARLASTPCPWSSMSAAATSPPRSGASWCRRSGARHAAGWCRWAPSLRALAGMRALGLRTLRGNAHVNVESPRVLPATERQTLVEQAATLLPGLAVAAHIHAAHSSLPNRPQPPTPTPTLAAGACGGDCWGARGAALRGGGHGHGGGAARATAPGGARGCGGGVDGEGAQGMPQEAASGGSVPACRIGRLGASVA